MAKYAIPMHYSQMRLVLSTLLYSYFFELPPITPKY